MGQYNSTILHVFGGQGYPLGLTALIHVFKIHQNLTGVFCSLGQYLKPFSAVLKMN